MEEHFLYSYSNTLENLQGHGSFFYREKQKIEVRIRIVYVFKDLGKRFFFLNQQTGVVTEKKSEMNVAKYGAEVST